MQRAERLNRLRALARLLDARIGIPGTPLRLGADSILGLVPGLGDVATGLVSLYIIAEAYDMGVGRATLRRMIWNVVLDTAFGSVPLVGDVFDMLWKANLRNVDLLERELAHRDSPAPTRR